MNTDLLIFFTAELDPEFVTRFTEARRTRGGPAGRSKKVVSISPDQDVVAALHDSGEGWQSRGNELLRAAIGLDRAQG